MFIITNVDNNYDIGKKDPSQGKYHTAPVIIFTQDKSRPGPQDIMSDLRWRRQHDQPYPNEVILNYLKPKFKEMKFECTRISYEYYAGCAMCPCSPGYICYGKTNKVNRKKRTAIWLDEV